MEFFWPVFRSIGTEYRKIRTRKNSLFRQFSCCVKLPTYSVCKIFIKTIRAEINKEGKCILQILGVAKKLQITMRKVPQFHLIPWCGNFVERRSFRIVSGDSPKTMRNCAFPQHFHTRKLGEITVFQVVAHIENFKIKPKRLTNLSKNEIISNK